MCKKILILMTLCFIPALLFPGGIQEEIKDAHTAYLAGDLNKALSLYEEAEIETPESPYIYFNKGLAYFRMEEYDKAKEAFLAAASKTKELSLEAQAYYNLGNTSFLEAGRYTESDLEKAISLYQEAITNYQVALERDKSLADAAHNIEVTRLIVRDLLDKLKKQQEQNKDQQDKIKKIVEKLAELIDRETREMEYTRTLKEEKENKGISRGLRNNTGKIKAEQEKIREDTVAVSGEIEELISQGMNPQGGTPQQPAPAVPPQGTEQLQQAKEHVDLAVNFQHLAENQLGNINLATALESETGARDELVKALETLSNPQDQQQQQQQDQQSKDDQEKKKEELQQAEDAEDILDEEREERQERQVRGQSGYREVERDW